MIKHSLFAGQEREAKLNELGEVQAGTKVYHHKLKRDITGRLRRDIRRRSAIEPAIGLMKNDGRLRSNWLKGADGDAFNALLCGCGHNLRMILRKLRLFFAFIAAWMASLHFTSGGGHGAGAPVSRLHRRRSPAAESLSGMIFELFRPD